MHLISTKCMPILLYALGACPVNTADTRSLDFAQSRLLMKLFKTASPNTVQEYRSNYVRRKTVTDLVLDRKRNFLPRDALVHRAVLRLHVVRLSVCLSVRPSVTLVDQDHIGWKSWKLIAYSIRPTPSLFVAERPST